jgi:hypothetical protein
VRFSPGTSLVVLAPVAACIVVHARPAANAVDVRFSCTSRPRMSAMII